MSHYQLRNTLLIFLLLMSIPTAFSAELQMSVKGQITTTGSCTFDNTGSAVQVDFGTVDFEKNPAGGNRLKTNPVKELSSHMVCTGDTSGARMTLNSSHVATDSDGNKVIAVMLAGGSEPSLGLRLKANDVVKSVATAFNIDANNPPKLSVELIQLDDGSSFTNGVAFSGSATLVLDFP